MAKLTHEEEKTTIGPDANGRYYYRAKSGKGYLNLKSPLDDAKLEDYEEITKEQWDAETYVAPHVPSEKEIAIREKKAQIAKLKADLAATDYCALKLAEGETTKNGEYKEIFAARKEWRAQINELQDQIYALENEVPTPTVPEEVVEETPVEEPTESNPENVGEGEGE